MSISSFSSSAAPAFSPGDISSCVLWLESKEGVEDDSGVTPGDTEPITTWTDTISGNTNVFEGTSTNRPEYIVGDSDIFDSNPAVKSDGSNDSMVRGDTSALDALATSEWTWIFRLKTPSSIATGTKTYVSKWDDTAPKFGYYHGEWNNSGSQVWRIQFANDNLYRTARGATPILAEKTYTVEMHNTDGAINLSGCKIYMGIDDATPLAEDMTAGGETLAAGGDNDEDVTIFSRGVGTTGYRPDHYFACIGFFNVDMLKHLSDLNNVRTYISANYP